MTLTTADNWATEIKIQVIKQGDEGDEVDVVEKVYHVTDRLLPPFDFLPHDRQVIITGGPGSAPTATSVFLPPEYEPGDRLRLYLNGVEAPYMRPKKRKPAK